jgi:Tol biopolymer transport system component
MKKYAVLALLALSACKKNDVDTTPINIQGDILFISRRTPNSAEWTLYMMNADGTNQRPLLNNYVRCTPPVLSRNGSKIAFTTYDNGFYNLYTINKDGQNLVFLSKAIQYCGSPAWSPDGSKILFVKNADASGGNYNIYSINSDGSNEVKLTDQHDNFSAQWSPDGSKIFFISAAANVAGIYSMNSNGTGRQLLTPQNKSFGGAVLSPDGNKLALVSNEWNGSQIFVMNTDGSGLKQLTFTVSPKYWDTGFPRDANGNPVWSPDGSKIAYVSWANGTPDIFVMNSNGLHNKRLTNGPIRDENPSWTKDGKYILFSSNRDMTMSSEIYIMKANGQSQTPLTKYNADDIYPLFIER